MADKQKANAKTVRKKENPSQGATKKPVKKEEQVTQISLQQYKEQEDNASLKRDICLILVFLFAILLELANFNLCGKLGAFLSMIQFGLFGSFAYLFPICLFTIMWFAFSKHGNRVTGMKIGAGIAILFIITSFMELIKGFSPELGYFKFFTQSADHTNGGGLFGATLLKIFVPMVGTLATVLILIALLLVAVCLLTGKAIIAYFSARSKEKLRIMREHHKEDEIQDSVSPLSEKTKQKSDLDREDDRLFEQGHEITESTLSTVKKDAPVVPGPSVAPPVVKDDDYYCEPFSEESERRMRTVTIKKDENYDKIRQKRLQEEAAIREAAMKKTNPEPVPGFVDALRERGQGQGFISVVGEDGKLTPVAELPTAGKNHELHEIVEVVTPETDADVSTQGSSGVQFYEEELLRKFGEASDDSGASTSTADLDNPTKKTARPKQTHEKQGTESPLLHVEALVKEEKVYQFPPIALLQAGKADAKSMSERDLREISQKLKRTLESFGVNVTVTGISCGPSVTRYELMPEQGVKVSRITALSNDIKLNLAASDIRIEAPIQGKAAVGIEIPNTTSNTVHLRDILETKEFTEHPSDLAFAVGRDIGGKTIVSDIADMPHLLIAGATGAGKSVCINSIIMSILYKAKPDDVRMIMIDPKVVELSGYNGIPHLLVPVVTDKKQAPGLLNWAIAEMESRYKRFADLGVKNIAGYNRKVVGLEQERMSQIVIIIDELSDLMMESQREIEDAISKLTAMSRAAGIYLIIATQRPSVDIITGVIKANIPSRIAFATSSAIDSRTILDMQGAEKLIGKGDMLFFPRSVSIPTRIQGTFVSDNEVSAVVDFLKANHSGTAYSEEIEQQIKASATGQKRVDTDGEEDERDPLFIECGKLIVEKDKASIGLLQRVHKIGFNRAGRIMDQLAEAGVVGPEDGKKPREVLMSIEQFEQYIEEYY